MSNKMGYLDSIREKRELYNNGMYDFGIEKKQRSEMLELLKDDSYKRGIDFIFSQVKELSDVGTKENYLSYLKTIFPDSKIKNLVWHGTDCVFDDFDDSYLQKKDPGYCGKGFYFWLGKDAEEGARHVCFSYTNDKNNIEQFLKVAILNIEAPMEIIRTSNFEWTGKEIPSKYDSVIENEFYDNDFPKETRQILVKNSNQIHVLGSKKDISGFKKYMKMLNS